MPAPQAQDARRGMLVQGLLWGGVGLAPLAILILLFGQSTGSLRVAVVLAVLTIVMIAVSIVLRPGVEMVRVDIEHRVLDEMERVRLNTRDDIATAARNTHRALSERMHALTATVDDLRAQLDEVQASAMLPPASPVPSPQVVAGPGVVRRTETVHVTRRTTMVGGEDDASSTGTVYGAKSAVDGEWRERPEPRHDERGNDDRHEARRHRNDRHDGDRHDGDRHDEDRPDEDRPDERHRPERHREERGHDDRRSDWDGMAAGDRWASVHADDSGRELRVGERRSSVRSDGRGTELRVEDRWAALRREEASERRDGGYAEADWESTFRSLSQRPDGVRALPPAPGDSPSRFLDDRHSEDRPREDRLREDRPREDRLREDRPREDRPRDDRHRDDRHRDDRHEDDRGRESVRSRGRERARERDFEGDRGHDGRGFREDDRADASRPDDWRSDDRHRDDRGHRPEERHHDDRHRDDRGHRPEERHHDDRHHDDRHQDDRGRDDPGYDDRGRGYSDRSYAPFQRSGRDYDR